MPKHGYTHIFNKLLKHNNISVELNCDATKLIDLKDGKISYKGSIYKGLVIYTGAIDVLFNHKFGYLPYRSLHFEHQTHKVNRFQSATVINFPDKRPETRRTENKLLVCQENIPDVTSTLTEYPGKYNPMGNKWNEPYYPIPSEKTVELYNNYLLEAKKFKNLILIGRLAEYKYYNMEAIINATLDKFEEIKKDWNLA
jgi:UDP-galactopyranose mutase